MPCWLVVLAWVAVLVAPPMAGAQALRDGRPAAAWRAAVLQRAHQPGRTGLMGRLGRINAPSGHPYDPPGPVALNAIGIAPTIRAAAAASLRALVPLVGIFVGYLVLRASRPQNNLPTKTHSRLYKEKGTLLSKQHGTLVSAAVSNHLSHHGNRARSALRAMGLEGDFTPEELAELVAEVRAMEVGGVPEDPEDSGGSEKLPELAAYEGPELPWSALEAGVELQELGVVVAVGPSSLGPESGNGLYVALVDGVAEVSLPQGTLLCGYARGTMQPQPHGNKSVAFAFDNLATPVFYNQQLMSLKDAVLQASAAASDGDAPLDVSHALYGHLVYEKEGQVAVAPDPEVTARYFVPTEPPMAEVGVTSLGMFANDLAFLNLDPEEELYASLSRLRNVLELVWRVEWDAETKRLVPSWPVVILAREVAFKNRHAMEVGVRYGWRYWQSAVAGLRESQVETPG